MLSVWVIHRSLNVHLDGINKIILHSLKFQLCYRNDTNVNDVVNARKGNSSKIQN